jgi:GDP/UDP-N,N'-diacetylbacillosamine 2-epimerase (hydrolysing)
LKKILVVTGTRAEYGLLRWVIDGIEQSHLLNLQLCVTGMHLSPEFGLTYRDIQNDGYLINSKIEMLLSSDTPVGVTKSMGLGLIGFADELERLSPDLVLLLGDRFETMVAATAATTARIPIAHIHGGESTQGCIDEAFRHSITKMSHIHFVASAEYRSRVIQLGENPATVFNVGGLGVDGISRLNLLSRKKLEISLGFKLGTKNILVTFHPVTLEKKTAVYQTKQLLCALSKLKDYKIIITMPNADTEGREIFHFVEKFVNENQNSISFKSLGQLRYLSCLKFMDFVIGNSSSGLLEVPSFRIPTVNIGNRQKGRTKAKSIIDCEPTKYAIEAAIKKASSRQFLDLCKGVVNPYGNGGASDSIIKIITRFDCTDILKKKFYNLSEDNEF